MHLVEVLEGGGQLRHHGGRIRAQCSSTVLPTNRRLVQAGFEAVRRIVSTPPAG